MICEKLRFFLTRARSLQLQEGLTGDQSPAYSGGGERLLDEWSRDGHRWKLGAGPCVVQKIEDGGSCHHDLQADLVYTGELIQGWDEDFTALWNEMVDEASLRE